MQKIVGEITEVSQSATYEFANRSRVTHSRFSIIAKTHIVSTPFRGGQNPTSVNSTAYNRRRTYVYFRIGWDNRGPFSPDAKGSEEVGYDPDPIDRKIPGAKMEGRSKEMGIALERTRWESRDSPSIDSGNALWLSYALSLSSLQSTALQFLYRSTLCYNVSQKQPILISKFQYKSLSYSLWISNQFWMNFVLKKISICPVYLSGYG